MKNRIKISIAGLISLAILYILNGKRIFFTMLLCSLIHECGHLFTMALLRVPVSEITVGFFNFNIKYNKLKTGYMEDVLISISGIVFNLITAFVAFRLCFETVFYTSLALAIINLLPINSIDGGNIIESIKLMFSEKREKEEKKLYDRKIRLYNKMFAPAFICFAVLFSGFNLSVVFTCVSAVICKTVE